MGHLSSLLLLVLLLVVSAGVLGGKGKEDKHASGKKPSPKKTLPPAPEVEPKDRTEAQWNALSLDEVTEACKAAGLSAEGVQQVMAARLATYYTEVRAEQSVLEQLTQTSSSHRIHPYTTPPVSLPASSSGDMIPPSIRAALLEYDVLLARYGSALDRAVQIQSEASAPTVSAPYFSQPGPSTGPTWSFPSGYSTVASPAVTAPIPPRIPGPGPLPSSASSGVAGNFPAVLATLRDTISDSVSNSITAALSALWGRQGGLGGFLL